MGGVCAVVSCVVASDRQARGKAGGQADRGEGRGAGRQAGRHPSEVASGRLQAGSMCSGFRQAGGKAGGHYGREMAFVWGAGMCFWVGLKCLMIAEVSAEGTCKST